MNRDGWISTMFIVGFVAMLAGSIVAASILQPMADAAPYDDLADRERWPSESKEYVEWSSTTAPPGWWWSSDPIPLQIEGYECKKSSFWGHFTNGAWCYYPPSDTRQGGQ